MMDAELVALATQLGQCLKANGRMIATAESCTGGGIAQIITEVSGSSAWFDRGFVTYSNLSKVQMLAVNPATLEKYGAVSEQISVEMVMGALAHSTADCAVAVTGIAGPDGGSLEKPVGTVFIAWCYKNETAKVIRKHYLGNRHQIRTQTVKTALEGLLL
ncbi:MAG: CinA family protein [Methylococcaceae bacterium]|nr:CinA family protein [Methylococcaceae bacterium]